MKINWICHHTISLVGMIPCICLSTTIQFIYQSINLSLSIYIGNAAVLLSSIVRPAVCTDHWPIRCVDSLHSRLWRWWAGGADVHTHSDDGRAETADSGAEKAAGTGWRAEKELTMNSWNSMCKNNEIQVDFLYSQPSASPTTLYQFIHSRKCEFMKCNSMLHGTAQVYSYPLNSTLYNKLTINLVCWSKHPCLVLGTVQIVLIIRDLKPLGCFQVLRFAGRLETVTRVK